MQLQMFETGASYRVIDKVGMPHALAFINARMVDFDTSGLDWIKLLPLSKNTLLHGECTFPYRACNDDPWLHGYRIRASVNVEMSPPFKYLHWGRRPSPGSRKGWVSGEQTFRFADLEECAVHTLATSASIFSPTRGSLPRATRKRTPTGGRTGGSRTFVRGATEGGARTPRGGFLAQ